MKVNRDLEQFINSDKYKNILLDPEAGFFLIDKVSGRASFSLVAEVRRKLNIKKVGFSGTLDPLASGLMILATGKATRLLDLFHLLTKEYEAEIEFGKSSATFDLEEKPSDVPVKKFDKIFLENIVSSFEGHQEQIVPIFSAKKVRGKKLHILARRGKTVDLPRTKIFINEIELLKFDFPRASLRIKCSAGTYIRSLARDLGQAVGSAAVLVRLRRTKIGNFDVKKAVQLEELTASELLANRLPVESSLKFLDQLYGRSQNG